MVSREALLIGLAAAIPGALLGLPVARLIHAELVSLGAVPDTLQLALSPLTVLAALVATVAAAWVAARITARRMARIRPIEALTEMDVEPRALSAARLVSGLTATAAAAGVTVLLRSLHTEPAAMPVTYVAVLLWMTAVALLGPLLTRAALAVLTVPLLALPVAGLLAAENAKANSRRLASVMTPLALLVGITLTILFVPATINDAARAQVKRGVTADFVVTADGPGVPEAAAQSLRADPGVDAVTEVLATTVWLGHHKHSAQGVTPAGLTSTIDLGVTAGSLARLGSGAIAMSDVAAGDHHVGDVLELTRGDGTKTQDRLVATYARGLGFSDVMLPYADIAGHVDDPLAEAVLIKGTTSLAQVTAQLTGFAGLSLADAVDYQATQGSRQHLNTDVDLIFMSLILGFTAIAIINTSATAIANRSREISLLRLIGATAAQVRGTLLVELAVVVAIAAALGTAAAWLTLDGFAEGLVGSGTPAFDPTTYVLVLAAAATLGLIGTIPPANLLLRRHGATTDAA